jgi:hypothetical protein
MTRRRAASVSKEAVVTTDTGWASIGNHRRSTNKFITDGYCTKLVVEGEHVGNKSQILYQTLIKPVPYNGDKIILAYQMHLRKQNTCTADPCCSAV